MTIFRIAESIAASGFHGGHGPANVSIAAESPV
jgi:hypothetical protein